MAKSKVILGFGRLSLPEPKANPDSGSRFHKFALISRESWDDAEGKERTKDAVYFLDVRTTEKTVTDDQAVKYHDLARNLGIYRELQVPAFKRGEAPQTMYGVYKGLFKPEEVAQAIDDASA